MSQLRIITSTDLKQELGTSATEPMSQVAVKNALEDKAPITSPYFYGEVKLSKIANTEDKIIYEQGDDQEVEFGNEELALNLKGSTVTAPTPDIEDTPGRKVATTEYVADYVSANGGGGSGSDASVQFIKGFYAAKPLLAANGTVVFDTEALKMFTRTDGVWVDSGEPVLNKLYFTTLNNTLWKWNGELFVRVVADVDGIDPINGTETAYFSQRGYFVETAFIIYHEQKLHDFALGDAFSIFANRNGSIEWNSTDVFVATVDTNGNVLITGYGNCGIIAILDGIEYANYEIRVPDTRRPLYEGYIQENQIITEKRFDYSYFANYDSALLLSGNIFAGCDFSNVDFGANSSQLITFQNVIFQSCNIFGMRFFSVSANPNAPLSNLPEFINRGNNLPTIEFDEATASTLGRTFIDDDFTFEETGLLDTLFYDENMSPLHYFFGAPDGTRIKFGNEVYSANSENGFTLVV